MEASVQAFAALADPVRASIVRMLACGDMTAGHIAAKFPVYAPGGLAPPGRVLRQAGLVSARDEAQQRIYSLETPAMDDMAEWLAQCRLLWNRRLDDLGRQLDRRAESRRQGESDEHD